MTEPLTLALVVASIRPGRLGPTVAAWFQDQVLAHGRFVVDIIDVASFDPTDDALAAAVVGSDAVVVVTPEYNHSFPGPLKTAIDTLREEWHAKPVGFVSYGGISGGLRAVEALRVVFAELHSVTVRETVALPLVWDRFDDTGRLHDAAGPEAAAVRLLDQLSWWALSVGAGRRIGPYAC